MDTADYWWMAQEYSIWNAAIASLQFWTEDLNPVTLGRAMEHVYSTFFYTCMSHTLHQQSDEILFGHFIIALNAAFNQQLSLVDEGYKSVSEPLTYPLHYERLLTFTMFPAWNTLPLTQLSPHLAVHHKHHPDQCADAYLLAQQTTAFQTALQHAQTALMMKKKKISRWNPWMINTGILKKHLTELYGLPHGLCQYPCPNMNYSTISYVDSLDLSDISDYEYYIVTSSDEEILGMEEVPY